MTPQVLIVAGSDSSGGAGVVRDVETVSAFGLRCSVAITAVTVQTQARVECVEHMPPDLVAAQMRAALDLGPTAAAPSSTPIAAIKIGMLGTAATVAAVASVLADCPPTPVVLDPVLASTSGKALLDGDAVGVLMSRLMPLSRLVTPNLPELALLTGQSMAACRQDIVAQAEMLLLAGARAVLVKGGHGEGAQSIDLLVTRDHAPKAFEAKRLPGSMRGTGCMLASAIAAHLALSDPLEDSVANAKRHVFSRLAAHDAARSRH